MNTRTFWDIGRSYPEDTLCIEVTEDIDNCSKRRLIRGQVARIEGQVTAEIWCAHRYDSFKRGSDQINLGTFGSVKEAQQAVEAWWVTENAKLDAEENN